MFNKKILVLLLSILFSLNVQAKKTNITPEIYLLEDITNDQVISKLNVDKIHSMASLTKLMTAYILINNHPNLDYCSTKITDEDQDLLKNTKTRVEKDVIISCKKLLEVMLVVSDNWAASALSKTIPNVSQDKFIELMNIQAMKWGMDNTYYNDVSGLSPSNKTTANDLKILVKNIIKNKQITDITSEKEFILIQDEKLTLLKNSNKLIREMDYSAKLSKTGYISESGYNLIYSPKDKCNGKNLVLIIMGAKTSELRAKFAEEILDKNNCN